jgi:hypothetical protein
MGSGPSIRLDRGSRVRLLATNTLRLERGAVYIDSAGGLGAATIEIQTAAGVVRDVGTQFEVRLLADRPRTSLRVRVREGVVEIDTDTVQHRLEAEEQLTLEAAAGVVRTRVDRDDSGWAWIQTIAPGFAIEGRSLGAFLTWAAREMGVSFEAADDTACAALADKLGGTVEHLAPTEAVAAVLVGVGLEHELVEGVLVIRGRALKTTR